MVGRAMGERWKRTQRERIKRIRTENMFMDFYKFLGSKLFAMKFKWMRHFCTIKSVSLDLNGRERGEEWRGMERNGDEQWGRGTKKRVACDAAERVVARDSLVKKIAKQLLSGIKWGAARVMGEWRAVWSDWRIATELVLGNRLPGIERAEDIWGASTWFHQNRQIN